MKIKSMFILIAFNLMVLPAVAQELLSKEDKKALLQTFHNRFVDSTQRSFGAKPAPAALVIPVTEKEGAANIIEYTGITFKTNSALLTPLAQEILDVAAVSMNYDRLKDIEFIIEGHTDPRGGYELNQRLSVKRAEAVLDYLVSNHSIDRSRLTVVGKNFSELKNTENPIAPENRRVTFRRR